MKLDDGRTVSDSGYCWICGVSRMSIDDRTCRALSCEWEHARRMHKPTVYRLDPLPRAFATHLLDEMRGKSNLDTALRALGKSSGYIDDADTIVWLGEFVRPAVRTMTEAKSGVRLGDGSGCGACYGCATNRGCTQNFPK